MMDKKRIPDKKYRRIMKTVSEKEFSAGGIVLKKTKDGVKALLIKDSYGRWTWPKGHIEKNESSKQAAEREIREEVGLTRIAVIQRLGRKVEYLFKRDRRLIFKTVYLFLVEATGNEKLVPLKSEIEEARWFSPDKAIRQVAYKGAKETVKSALKKFKELRG